MGAPHIDWNGIYHGERMRRLSRAAHLYFPHIMQQLVNSVGRMEVNYNLCYHKLLIYIRDAEEEQAFRDILTEYVDAKLAFPYYVNGRLWLQFDLPDHLQHFRCKKERELAVPPADQYEAWRRSARGPAKPIDDAPFFRSCPPRRSNTPPKPPLEPEASNADETSASTQTHSLHTLGPIVALASGPKLVEAPRKLAMDEAMRGFEETSSHYYESTGVAHNEIDLADARPEWRRLDLSQKLAAKRYVDEYALSGQQFFPSFRNYLIGRKWTRTVLKPATSQKYSAAYLAVPELA